MQLVDGNSVNYAESSGKVDYHTQYDSDSIYIYDPEVRKEVRKGWKSPSDNQRDKDYFNKKSSEEKANELLEG